MYAFVDKKKKKKKKGLLLFLLFAYHIGVVTSTSMPFALCLLFVQGHIHLGPSPFPSHFLLLFVRSHEAPSPIWPTGPIPVKNRTISKPLVCAYLPLCLECGPFSLFMQAYITHTHCHSDIHIHIHHLPPTPFHFIITSHLILIKQNQTFVTSYHFPLFPLPRNQRSFFFLYL